MESAVMRGGPHGDERCLSVAAQRPPRSAQRGRSNAAALGLLEVLTTRAIASLGTMNDPPDTLDDLREMLAVVVSHIEDWRAKGPERTIAAPARNAGARVVIVDRFERGGRWFIVGVEQRGDAALTKRESQVVDAAIGGRSNKYIAYELGVSDSTVRVLLARAARKLGVRTRAELVAGRGGQSVITQRAENA